MSLFRKSLAGVRFGTGAWLDGHWVESAPSIINFEASVQPTIPHDLLSLDIARRERKSYTLYTDYKLKCLTPAIQNPDCVDIDGERYEVSAEAPWRNNVISHYKYIITYLNAIEDPIPDLIPAGDFTSESELVDPSGPVGNFTYASTLVAPLVGNFTYTSLLRTPPAPVVGNFSYVSTLQPGQEV